MEAKRFNQVKNSQEERKINSISEYFSHGQEKPKTKPLRINFREPSR